MKLERPRYLNLLKIRLPLPGVVSLLHRISGFLLFAAIPLLLYLLEQSLSSAENFAHIHAFFSAPLAKLLLLLLGWALLQHLFSGIRHLFLDCHLGVSLPAARLSSKWVLFASAGFTLLLGVKLL